MHSKADISKKVNEILYGASNESELMEKFILMVQKEAYDEGHTDGYAQRVDEENICE